MESSRFDSIPSTTTNTSTYHDDNVIHDQQQQLPPPLQQQQQPPPTHGDWNVLHRLQIFWSQLSLHEISGSAGDLGTFIPLFVALGRERSIYVAPALFWAGLSNILTGFLWDVPMPVQPMKTIAALAIAQGLNRSQVIAAGMWMGLFMVILGATNGIEWVNRIVPKSVVAGLQLGVGMSLAIHGIEKMILTLPIWSDPDCILMAIVAGLGTLYGLRLQQEQMMMIQTTTTTQHNTDSNSSSQIRLPIPVGLYLLLLAATIGLLRMALQQQQQPSLNNNDGNSNKDEWTWEPVLTWTLSDISFHDWTVGLWEGALPQLPLTTLNSVISVCALAHTLFPEKRHNVHDIPQQQQHHGNGHDGNGPTTMTTTTTTTTAEEGTAGECLDTVLSRREVAYSVGIMNLLACPLGGLPNCHGAGGLAGQHQLGARHGTSIVFLGIVKMTLALTLGAAVLHLLDAFPLSVLGVMMAMAGHELALTGYDCVYKWWGPHHHPR